LTISANTAIQHDHFKRALPVIDHFTSQLKINQNSNHSVSPYQFKYQAAQPVSF
jgi:hypothetical protein